MARLEIFIRGRFFLFPLFRATRSISWEKIRAFIGFELKDYTFNKFTSSYSQILIHLWFDPRAYKVFEVIHCVILFFYQTALNL